jgi:ATP-dependent Lon protease
MFADTVAPILSIAIDRRQDLLETGDVVARLEKILAIVATDRKAA